MDDAAPTGERIEEWDWETGRPTGRAVDRKRSHREGIPHEGVHLWIIRTVDPGGSVLFQQRAPDKDLYPDCLDITVGGHVPFGTAGSKIQKEAYEEIGVTPRDADLEDLGLFRYEERDERHFHREFQRVYLMEDNRPLVDYRFIDGEVTGIYAVPLDLLKRLMTQDIDFTVSGFDGRDRVDRQVSQKDFHPLLFAPSMATYMAVLFAAMDQHLAGVPVTARMPEL